MAALTHARPSVTLIAMALHTSARSRQSALLATLPIALYLRISDDKYKDERGVDRQEVDGRKMIAALGRECVLYVDNDISAYKRNKVRPAFQQMARDLEDGKIGGIVAVALDRLWRRYTDLDTIVKIYERTPGLYFATMEKDLDLSNSDDRFQAQIMVSVSEKYSADNALKVTNWHRHQAVAGHVSSRRVFGWEGDALHPVESVELRRAIERVQAGASNGDIVRDFNERGVLTSAGREWTTSTWRNLIRNPRLKGERWKHVTAQVYEPVCGEDGHVVKGSWAPLLTGDEFDALQDHLDGRASRYVVNGRRGVPKNLLTGILRCGHCGRGLCIRRSGKKSSYACPAAGSGGCGRIARSSKPLDQFITATVFERLRLDAALDGTQEDASAPDIAPALDAIDGKLASLQARWVDDLMSDEEFYGLRDALSGKRKVLVASLRAVTKARSGTAVHNAEERWETLTLAEQRRVVQDAISSATVVPYPVVDGKKVRLPVEAQVKLSYAI